MRLFSAIFYLYLLSIIYVPSNASAQGLAQLAQCSGPDCGTCNVMYMANGIIIWLIGFLFLIFAILVMRAGIKLVVSAGNPSALTSAKESFTNAIIGFIIILAAWLIVDTLMRALVGTPDNPGQLQVEGSRTGFLFWSEVQCTFQYQPQECTEQNRCTVVIDIEPVDFIEGNFSGSEDVFGSSSPPPSAGGQTTARGGFIPVTLRDGTVVQVFPCATGAAERVNVPLFGGTAHVHRSLAPSLQRINAEWLRRGGNSFYQVSSVGGYACRNIAGTNRLSNHAYGMAVDINPDQNPHCPPWSQCNGVNRLITDMPQEFRQLFINEGWGWGGNWNSSKDAMHFSKVGGEQGDQRGE